MPRWGILAIKYRPSNELKGLLWGAAMKRAPVASSSSSGELTETVPTFDASGQPSPGRELKRSAAYWAGEQVARPSPWEGLIVTPLGKVTSTFFGWPSAAVASGFNNPELGMLRLKVRPLGFSASLEVGAASICGSKGTFWQPRRGSPVKEALAIVLATGTFHGSVSTLKSSGALQLAGIRRKAVSGSAGGRAQGGREFSSWKVQLQPRALSCFGSLG